MLVCRSVPFKAAVGLQRTARSSQPGRQRPQPVRWAARVRSRGVSVLRPGPTLEGRLLGWAGRSRKASCWARWCRWPHLAGPRRLAKPDGMARGSRLPPAPRPGFAGWPTSGPRPCPFAPAARHSAARRRRPPAARRAPQAEMMWIRPLCVACDPSFTQDQQRRSALPRLHPRVGLVDDKGASAAADDLGARLLLQRGQGVANLHGWVLSCVVREARDRDASQQTASKTT